MNEEDYEIEDLIGNLNKKKARKKNTSKKKGNRGENQLCDVLEARFPGKSFYRVVGSGARIHQVDVAEEMKAAFTGDIVCPFNFKWCVECKYGYQDTEIMSFFEGGNKLPDEWREKIIRDAANLGRKPILCWRKPRQPWLAFLPTCHVGEMPPYHLTYRDWSFVPLNYLLARPDDFWLS